ncbi:MULTISPECIES: hypothetical protein [Bacteria]|jgi:hypothetical protein
MVRTLTAASPVQTAAEDRLALADAALALAGHEITDPALRAIVKQAARRELTGDEARAEIRRHVQG